MKDPRDIIIAPIVSREELRAHRDRRLHVPSSQVGQQARDPRRGRESIWGVEVLKVNTLNRKGKRKRTRGTNRVGTKPATKRAIVTLAAGEIPLFEN